MWCPCTQHGPAPPALHLEGPWEEFRGRQERKMLPPSWPGVRGPQEKSGRRMVLALGSVRASQQPVETSRNAAVGQPGAVSAAAFTRCRPLHGQQPARGAGGGRLSAALPLRVPFEAHRQGLLSLRGGPASSATGAGRPRGHSRPGTAALHSVREGEGARPLDRGHEPPGGPQGGGESSRERPRPNGRINRTFVSSLTHV